MINQYRSENHRISSFLYINDSLLNNKQQIQNQILLLNYLEFIISYSINESNQT